MFSSSCVIFLFIDVILYNLNYIQLQAISSIQQKVTETVYWSYTYLKNISYQML